MFIYLFIVLILYIKKEDLNDYKDASIFFSFYIFFIFLYFLAIPLLRDSGMDFQTISSWNEITALGIKNNNDHFHES